MIEHFGSLNAAIALSVGGYLAYSFAPDPVRIPLTFLLTGGAIGLFIHEELIKDD